MEASPQELASTGQAVGSSADQLQRRVQALSARVESLLGGGWKGQAADAFRRDWQTWLDGARKVVGGLDQTAHLLTSQGQAYQASDDANADTLRRSGSSLNI